MCIYGVEHAVTSYQRGNIITLLELPCSIRSLVTVVAEKREKRKKKRKKGKKEKKKRQYATSISRSSFPIICSIARLKIVYSLYCWCRSAVCTEKRYIIYIYIYLYIYIYTSVISICFRIYNNLRATTMDTRYTHTHTHNTHSLFSFSLFSSIFFFFFVSLTCPSQFNASQPPCFIQRFIQSLAFVKFVLRARRVDVASQSADPFRATFFLFHSVSLSLNLTHTHTHTHSLSLFHAVFLFIAPVIWRSRRLGRDFSSRSSRKIDWMKV